MAFVDSGPVAMTTTALKARNVLVGSVLFRAVPMTPNAKKGISALMASVFLTFQASSLVKLTETATRDTSALTVIVYLIFQIAMAAETHASLAMFVSEVSVFLDARPRLIASLALNA